MCLDTKVPRDNDWSLAASSKEIIHVIDDYNLDPKDRDKKNCVHKYVHTCRFYSLQLLDTTLNQEQETAHVLHLIEEVQVDRQDIDKESVHKNMQTVI